jgi:hypothetical protein
MNQTLYLPDKYCRVLTFPLRRLGLNPRFYEGTRVTGLYIHGAGFKGPRSESASQFKKCYTVHVIYCGLIIDVDVD